jgi:hypothetical protein
LPLAFAIVISTGVRPVTSSLPVMMPRFAIQREATRQILCGERQRLFT